MYFWTVFKDLNPQTELMSLGLSAIDRVGKFESVERRTNALSFQ